MLKGPLNILVLVADDLLVGVVRCQSGEGVAGADGRHPPAAGAEAIVFPGRRLSGGEEGGGGTDAEGGRRAQLLLGGFGRRWQCEPPKENACGRHGADVFVLPGGQVRSCMAL